MTLHLYYQCYFSRSRNLPTVLGWVRPLLHPSNFFCFPQTKGPVLHTGNDNCNGSLSKSLTTWPSFSKMVLCYVFEMFIYLFKHIYYVYYQKSELLFHCSKHLPKDRMQECGTSGWESIQQPKGIYSVLQNDPVFLQSRAYRFSTSEDWAIEITLSKVFDLVTMCAYFQKKKKKKVVT